MSLMTEGNSSAVAEQPWTTVERVDPEQPLEFGGVRFLPSKLEAFRPHYHHDECTVDLIFQGGVQGPTLSPDDTKAFSKVSRQMPEWKQLGEHEGYPILVAIEMRLKDVYQSNSGYAAFNPCYPGSDGDPVSRAVVVATKLKMLIDDIRASDASVGSILSHRKLEV